MLILDYKIQDFVEGNTIVIFVEHQSLHLEIKLDLSKQLNYIRLDHY